MTHRSSRDHVGRAGLAAIVLGIGIGGLLATRSASAPTRAASLPHPLAAAWPTPIEETYNGCPPGGDGGDHLLNLRKNRIDTAPWQPVPLAGLLTLPWPVGVDRVQRTNWPAADAAMVARNEGRPIIAEGYILKVRHEGSESPNCHDPGARDYHVWLAASARDSRAHSIVVEIAPRVAARNPGWGGEAAILGLAGRHVRIGGWLMLDQEHAEQVRRTRATLWEIHPVMQIIVDHGGTWIDLETGKSPTGGAQPPGTVTTATPPPAVAQATATAVGITISGHFAVSVTVQPNPTRDGTATTVTGHTTTGAQCTVRVIYASGSAARSAALQTTQTASNDGAVSWTWTPSTKTPGVATATVTCTLGGTTASGRAAFTIQ